MNHSSTNDTKTQNAGRPKGDGIVVLDYGSQYTLLIARRLREIGAYSEVIDGASQRPPEGLVVRGIILSGGPDSVTEAGSRALPDWVLKHNVPVLGVCYGMGLLVEAFGGKMRSATRREYGQAHLKVNDVHNLSRKKFLGEKLFDDTPLDQTVWMSHGDDVAEVPKTFQTAATTDDGVVAAMVHDTLPIAALQYHPEVAHSEFGKELLRNFATKLCQLELNWDGSARIQSLCQYIEDVVGQGHVLVACSGGVDSTVTAALLLKALGPQRVTAVFCDTGLLRQNEVPWVAEKLKVLGLQHLEVLSSSDRFFEALKGVTDPEEKRKIIGKLFIEEFEAYAKKHPAFTHLGQGTLYPDVIESAGHGSGAKVIKSHHNVGGLPDRLALKLCEPFRWLFKDEVRSIGLELGLPLELIERHPFPGPGLAVRILGEVTRERVKMLQQADHVFISSLKEHGLYHVPWQAFAALLPIKSVGVMGDNRTYQQTIALRAVTSSDGMTAGVAELPLSFLTKVADQIVRQVHGINRVVYDITTKPPATIEWE
ncbi:MAG: glutamine-hydrolyzing GMP synthase [Proteobacteria bacterium]|nr:glutamine-hydrolyzing GMP synthase [Pseudomonadota bacterium]